MPTFCRHNRFLHSCPICSPQEAAPPAPRRAGGGTATRTRRSGTARPGGVRVRRVARAADDGYAGPLVPGLRASADARTLAGELGFATGRLAWLAAGPEGFYGDIASLPDREEALWLAALAAVLGPLEGEDPFATVRAVHVPWGEDPDLEGAELGPRAGAPSAAEAARVLSAYRGWAQRAGSQAAALGGEPSWSSERRFERAFERLGSVGMARGARFDLLVVLDRLGLLDARPPSLWLGDRDETSLAAKRVFGIGERFLLDRRAGDLAAAAGVPLEALDLALANLDAPERITLGAPAGATDAEAAARAERVLGVDAD